MRCARGSKNRRQVSGKRVGEGEKNTSDEMTSVMEIFKTVTWREVLGMWLEILMILGVLLAVADVFGV